MEKKLTFRFGPHRAASCAPARALMLALPLALALACSGCAAHSSEAARSAGAKAGAEEGATAAPQGHSPRKRASLHDILAILSGALSWSHQDWAAAASSFLDAERVASESGDSLLRDYAVYGLASTYLAQDEYDSALARLSELDARVSPEIGSGIWYQAGIIAFRKGEYADAAEMFRKSLEYDPSRSDAKLNLELSKRSLSDTDAKRSASASAFSGNEASGEDADTVFNLVRKKEQDRWKNQEEQASRENVADY
ncbi:MAG TPA: tetratricopeptide repeat protein [Treponemataceae bacterium]|nr:tetratricopeptide repeat protein [Treponemataceae bacterium]HPS44936.1 tetratricopeptide repeat protein [Treponemataceae bacterium]